MQSQTSDTFPSHCENNEPISCYYDPAFCYTRPFSIHSESNLTSKQENNLDLPPLSFFHFPSPPFEDTQIFLEQHHDFLLQFHHKPPPQNHEPQPVNVEVETCAKKNIQAPRKRPGKRDRHSKISTARGLRDRRMRLSLDVAKRFFGLQDMLGFDKASKTVEWLLNQAKAEINRLVKEKKKQKKSVPRSCSSAGSDCEEGVSSLDEVAVSRDQEEAGEDKRVEKVMLKRRVKHSRKISAFHPLARECRERARERARERTREKMRTRGLAEESKPCREEEHQNLIQLGSWKPSETGEEFGSKSHIVHPSLDVITEGKEHSYYAKEHDDDSLVILSKWSPSLIFNNYGFSQDHQFAEFQSLGKPWEA